jgi:hypothetical protein
MADVARFTELLFGDQTLDDLLTSLDKQAAADGAWILLGKAAECLRQGDVARATEVLLEVVGSPKMETRILLWSWATLRYLGVHPKSYEADDIEGVVIQVPMERGTDVLAAYADGTARYVNHSGKAIVWEITDATITGIIRKLLESCKQLWGVVGDVSGNHLVKDMVRVTLLTLKGNRFAEASMQSLVSSPINQVLGVGAELMANLIRRSESMDRLVSKNSSARLRRNF